MYTLLLPGRSHVINDDMAEKIIAALEANKRVESIGVEMNGEGSGNWELIINVRQVIALVKHPSVPSSERPNSAHLRIVPN